MIRVDGLTIAFNELNGIFDLSMEVPRGSTCAVIGPSGCGKTTLLHGLAGFLQADSGSFELAGNNGTPRVGLVQQKDALFPWLTVEANVALGLKDRKSRSSRVKSLLGDLGIGDTADQYPGRISGGQRQRASIARSLIVEPDILLLDEPTASLDAFSREALQDLLLRLHREYPLTTLFVTHSIEEALFLGEKVLVMGRGRIHYEHFNSLYPDPAAREHQRFYDEVVTLRSRLGEVIW